MISIAYCFAFARRKPQLIGFCFLSLIMSAAVVGHAAEISEVASEDDAQNVVPADHIPYIAIDGPIAEGDFDKFVELAGSFVSRGHRLTVVINSSGGDVLEAMKIGQVVRSTFAEVVVTGSYMKPSSQQPLRYCYSACVLIIVAAAKRDHVMDNEFYTDDGHIVWEVVDGEQRYKAVPVIGIHRPYYLGDEYRNLSPSQASEQYAELERAVRQYLSEMGVSDSFSDEMFRHASNRIHLVSHEEFIDLFGFEEPFLEEWFISKCGALDEQEIEDSARILADRILRQDDSFLPDGISRGYSDYLSERNESISACKDRELLSHQRSLLQQR